MNSPVVEFITPEKTTQQRDEQFDRDQSEKMFNISLTNIQNNASWDLSDIILSTPTTLSHTISKRADYAPFNINPAVIVFDECETYYEEDDDKRLKPLTNILKTFFTQDPDKASREFIECNKRRQFIFAGSSMQSSLITQFKRMFPGIVDMESESYGRVPPQIEHQNVYIENDVDNDIMILVNLLKDKILKEIKQEELNCLASDRDLPRHSVIVFCENKTKSNRICEELSKAGIINLPFNDDTKRISLKMRYRTLNMLHEGRIQVLVSDNLGSRGIDTMNVSHVIQFEYAKSSQEYLQRVGRTGRMG